MSKRSYPHNKVRYWLSYDLHDVCTLFADKDGMPIHVQTVRRWINKFGLKTLDKRKPTLIHGNDLIEFLKAKNSKHKCVTAFSEFFCMSCQDARPVFQNLISINQKTPFLKAQGICRICKAKMNKSFKIESYSELKQNFKLVDVSQLYDRDAPADKTHIRAPPIMHINESLNEEQFDLFS